MVVMIYCLFDSLTSHYLRGKTVRTSFADSMCQTATDVKDTCLKMAKSMNIFIEKRLTYPGNIDYSTKLFLLST